MFPLPSIPAKLAAVAALLVAAFVTGLVYGMRLEGGRHAEYIASQARAAVAVVVRQGAVTERVVTRYLKVKGETEVRTVTIEKEVQNYANAGACIDADWVRLHNAAAAGALPGTPGRIDGPLRTSQAHGGGDSQGSY